MRTMFVAATTIVAPIVVVPAHTSSPPVAAPTITYLDPPTPEQQAIVDWAAGRYAEAGMRLPDVSVSFPVTCVGADGRPLGGRYLRDRDEIELCLPTRRLALHELAHAWDDHADIDRDAFLAVRDADHWYEAVGSRPSGSGGEQLARLVTWGLMDVDITWPSPEYPGQPNDERPRLLPGLEDCTIGQLTELFVIVTGVEPLTPGAASDVTP